MIIRSISGSEIDHALTLAMQATLYALVDEGFVDETKALEFNDSHFCTIVNEDNVWHRIRRWIGMDSENINPYPVVFKVATKRAYSIEKLLEKK